MLHSWQVPHDPRPRLAHWWLDRCWRTIIMELFIIEIIATECLHDSIVELAHHGHNTGTPSASQRRRTEAKLLICYGYDSVYCWLLHAALWGAYCSRAFYAQQHNLYKLCFEAKPNEASDAVASKVNCNIRRSLRTKAEMEANNGGEVTKEVIWWQKCTMWPLYTPTFQLQVFIWTPWLDASPPFLFFDALAEPERFTPIKPRWIELEGWN